jgi:hypothetical protein
MMLDVRRLKFGIRRFTFVIERLTFDVRSLSEVSRLTFNVPRLSLFRVRRLTATAVSSCKNGSRQKLPTSVRRQRGSGGEDVDGFSHPARRVDPPGDDQRIDDGSRIPCKHFCESLF